MNEKISKLFTHIKKNSRKIKLKTSKPMKNIMEMSRKIKIQLVTTVFFEKKGAAVKFHFHINK